MCHGGGAQQSGCYPPMTPVNRFFRSALFPLIVIVLLVYLASQTLIPRKDAQEKVTYSEFIQQAESGNVQEATFSPTRNEIKGTLVGGDKYKVNYPSDLSAHDVEQILREENVQYDSKGKGSSWWSNLLISLLPFALLIGFWIFLMNQVQGGGSKVMSFGKSRAKRMTPDSPKIGFKDVAGGASRVRDLFEQAKQSSPCIIFMDEIDAVGRHRGAGLGGGHDEREQTLNQLLVEMDGFEMKDNIILIAATNRPDILDPALLRPGRFDRQIVVDRPDRNGRKKILEVHVKGKPIASEVELDTLAAGTPGFTGADLANLVNEAALLAARRGKKTIEQEELEEGIMRVIAGPEKKTRLLSEEERKVTAYHEMGHALVGHHLDQDTDVHKISVISRGQALGYTISLPREDRYLTRKSTLMDQLAATLGGRAAEELVFNEVTTGAANDLEKVTSTAKQMIMRFGMSEKLGPRVLGRNHDLPFLGREMSAEPDYSEEVAREIDEEIRRVIEEAHERAHQVLKDHMDELHRLSAILIERETIDKEQFVRLLDGASEEEVFPEEAPAAEAEEKPSRERKPAPKPKPFPVPGAMMQPPPPDPAKP